MKNFNVIIEHKKQKRYAFITGQTREFCERWIEERNRPDVSFTIIEN